MEENAILLATLRALKTDPTQAVVLYEQLFQAHLIALVEDPRQPLSSLNFLTYPSGGGISELPLFTSPRQGLLAGLCQQTGATPLSLHGPALWTRLLDVLGGSQLQAAVDPGEAHGIRVTREMALGMVKKYGAALPS